MNKLQSCMLMVLSLALLAGCESVNTAERSEPIAQSDPVTLRKVEPDATLRAQAQIVSANQGVVSGNLLKVQVVVRNKLAIRKTFHYKWEWYDVNGMMVDSPTTRLWQVARLQPKESIAITGIGPKPDVVDFRLKLVERP